MDTIHEDSRARAYRALQAELHSLLDNKTPVVVTVTYVVDGVEHEIIARVEDVVS